jgi:hypothetical protein
VEVGFEVTPLAAFTGDLQGSRRVLRTEGRFCSPQRADAARGAMRHVQGSRPLYPLSAFGAGHLRHRYVRQSTNLRIAIDPLTRPSSTMRYTAMMRTELNPLRHPRLALSPSANQEPLRSRWPLGRRKACFDTRSKIDMAPLLNRVEGVQEMELVLT